MAAKTKTTKKRTIKTVKAKPTVKLTSTKESSKKSIKSKKLALILSFVILAGLIYLGRSFFVAAFVNGRPILRLTLVKELERKQGKEILDSLVQRELISQEAKKQNITVTNEEVQAEIERITKAVEAQGVTLDAALSYQGQTREDLEQNIRLQKTMEQLLADKLAVSDEDVRAYFDQNKSMYGTDPDFEALKDTISDQLKQQKLSTEFQTWLENIKTDSKINYFVSF